MIAVQAVDGQPGAGIHRRGDAFSIGGGSENTVLRRKQRLQPDARGAQNRQRALQRAINRAGIGQQADAPITQRLETIPAQNFNPAEYVAH